MNLLPPLDELWQKFNSDHLLSYNRGREVTEANNREPHTSILIITISARLFFHHRGRSNR